MTVARRKPGHAKDLSDAKQGRYDDAYGPYAEPVLRIVPGNIVTAEAKDAFGNKITSGSHGPPTRAARQHRGPEHTLGASILKQYLQP